MPSRAPDQTAQDIAPSLIGRQDPVRYHEGRRTDVVRDQTDRHIILFICMIGLFRQHADRVADRLHRIDVKDRIHILHDHRQPL